MSLMRSDFLRVQNYGLDRFIEVQSRTFLTAFSEETATRDPYM